MTTQSSPDSLPVDERAVASTSVARRRLLRAGLSAAPVLAALKSNTVLAGDHTCIRPSSFSSLAAANMVVSKGRMIKTDYSCYSHGYWKNHEAGLPSGFKSKKFLPDSNGTLGFTANPGGEFTGLTLQNVLDKNGNDNNTALARHVVASYLSAVAYPGNEILTKQQCVDCWNNGGNWSPFPGTNWTNGDTLAYFNKIYGAKFL